MIQSWDSQGCRVASEFLSIIECLKAFARVAEIAFTYRVSPNYEEVSKSLFARGISIDSRAYVISQHACWPIRTPSPTCANQDAWVVITPKWPKANSMHTAAWHAWTRTPPLNFDHKAVFSLLHFPASFIRLWPSCHFDSWDRDMVGFVPRTSRIPPESLVFKKVNKSGFSQFSQFLFSQMCSGNP